MRSLADQMEMKGRVKNGVLQMRFSFGQAKARQKFQTESVKTLGTGSNFRRVVSMCPPIFGRWVRLSGMGVGISLLGL